MIVFHNIATASPDLGLQEAVTSVSILIGVALLTIGIAHLRGRASLIRDRALASLRPSAWRTIGYKETGWRAAASEVTQFGDITTGIPSFFSVLADSSGLEIWIGGDEPQLVWHANAHDVVATRTGSIARGWLPVPTIWVSLRTVDGTVDLPVSVNNIGRIAVWPGRLRDLEAQHTALKAALATSPP